MHAERCRKVVQHILMLSIGMHQRRNGGAETHRWHSQSQQSVTHDAGTLPRSRAEAALERGMFAVYYKNL